jgi:multimeric flavodoxin WrbA
LKKLVLINSSFRKKSTYSLLKKIEPFLADYDVEFLSIKDFDVTPCIGCENCLRRGNCNIKDEANILLAKMSEADGIIIGTPVYLRQISGYLKILIDRGCAWYHRSPLVGKPIFFVTATQVTGSKQAVHYLNDVSIQWGTINTGALSRTMFNIDDDIKQESLAKFIYYLDDSNKGRYRPKLKQVLEFQTQKVLAVNILPLDLAYWTDKGYIHRSYFYACRIDVFKLIVAAAYYKMLTYFIKKNKTE